MKIIQNIRRKAGESFLIKSATQVTRQKAMVNLKKATSVGILFELENEQIYQTIHDFATKLQHNKIRVKVIGYTSQDHLMRQFLPVLSIDIIGKKDLNWYYRPITSNVGDFVMNRFDICINLASPSNMPLKYIAAQSAARLKVGPYAEKDQDIYDLMIHTEEVHDQGKFLDNVHEYLTILNPKEDA